MAKEETMLVKNTINMNVEQSDLIEVLIEDKKQELENAVEAGKARREIIKGLLDQMRTDMNQVVVDEIYPKSKLETLYRTLNSAGIKCIVKGNVSVMEDRAKPYYKGQLVDISNLTQRYKDPMRNISNQSYSKEIYLYVFSELWLTLETTESKEISGNLYSMREAKPRGKSLKKLLGQYETLQKEDCDIKVGINQMEVDLVKLEYGEKRVKAQFIKASLGKSAEGKHILTLLDQVKKGTKLLG